MISRLEGTNVSRMKVCLSYSSQDKEEVQLLAKDLRVQGAHVWLDEWEMRISQSIMPKFQARLAKCNYLGIWLTARSVQTKWVEQEWIAILQDGVKRSNAVVLPLLAEDCDIPTLLQDNKYVDFRQDYNVGLNALFSRLYPKRENYIRSLVNIKRNTTFLWQELSFLPVNKAKEVTCEIKSSSLAAIASDLSNLSNNGKFFEWVSVVEYKMKREEIYSLTITNISDDLFPLVDIACQKEHAW